MKVRSKTFSRRIFKDFPARRNGVGDGEMGGERERRDGRGGGEGREDKEREGKGERKGIKECGEEPLYYINQHVDALSNCWALNVDLNFRFRKMDGSEADLSPAKIYALLN